MDIPNELRKEAIVIQVSSVTAYHKISRQFPELKPELLTEDGRKSKGIMSRGKEALKLLKKGF
jgi:hypothetical protein